METYILKKTRREFLKNSKNLLITGAIASTLSGFIKCGITEPEQGSYYVITEKCTGCGDCITICRRNAIKLVDNKAKIDKIKCTNCGDCQRICTEKAIAH